MNKIFYAVFVLSLISINSYCQDWLSDPSKTTYRWDAGLAGSSGATSGFFQMPHYPPGNVAANYPHNNPTWWHLLDIRHNNPANNYAMQFAGEFFGQDLYFRKTNNNASTAWSRVLLETNGRVGVGTLNPATALHIGGDNFITLGDYTNTSGVKGILFTGYRDIQANYFGASIEATPSWTCCSGYPNGGYAGIKEVDLNFNMRGKTTAMKISYDGNIGIGNTTPLAKLDVSGNIYCRNTLFIGTPDAATTPIQIGGYALAVTGTAIFNKAKVKSYGTWPDYVFDENYTLLPLASLEIYLRKNKHLPGVPTAEKVAKEGIDLGDNQAVLLQKIEELTLYMLEINKKVEALSKENEILKKKISVNNP